jgi:hypothetical protein
MDNYLAQRYGHLEFAADGSMIGKPLSVPKQSATGDESTQASSSSGGVVALVVSALGIGGDGEADAESDTSISRAVPMVAAPKSTWKALPKRGDAFDFVIVEEDVQSYGASVHWVNDDTIRLNWFYGSPDQPMQGDMQYRRISRDACGQKCDAAACDEKTTSN